MRLISLITSAAIVALMFVPEEYKLMMSISIDSCAYTRITYMLFHVNWAHCIINVYAFLSMAFLSGANVKQFLMALAIACTVPDFAIGCNHMMGMSVMTFSLAGILVCMSRKVVRLFLINATIMIPTFAIPGIAAMAHAYGFLIGFVLCLMFSRPIFKE